MTVEVHQLNQTGVVFDLVGPGADHEAAGPEAEAIIETVDHPDNIDLGAEAVKGKVHHTYLACVGHEAEVMIDTANLAHQRGGKRDPAAVAVQAVEAASVMEDQELEAEVIQEALPPINRTHTKNDQLDLRAPVVRATVHHTV